MNASKIFDFYEKNFPMGEYQLLLQIHAVDKLLDQNG